MRAESYIDDLRHVPTLMWMYVCGGIKGLGKSKGSFPLMENGIAYYADIKNTEQETLMYRMSKTVWDKLEAELVPLC